VLFRSLPAFGVFHVTQWPLNGTCSACRGASTATDANWASAETPPTTGPPLYEELHGGGVVRQFLGQNHPFPSALITRAFFLLGPIRPAEKYISGSCPNEVRLGGTSPLRFMPAGREQARSRSRAAVPYNQRLPARTVGGFCARG
jgi:hypothetical protein